MSVAQGGFIRAEERKVCLGGKRSLWSGWALMTDGQRLALAGPEAVAWQYRFHHLLVDGEATCSICFESKADALRM